MNHAEQMMIFDSGVMKAFGVNCVRDSNLVDIGIRHNPTIQFGSGPPIRPNPRNVDWKRDSNGLRYLNPSSVNKWAVLCFDSVREDVG